MGFSLARIDGELGTFTLAELQARPDLDQIRDKLRCPTAGCVAHLSYVAATHPYLKKRNLSVHSEFCDYHDGTIDTVQRKRGRRTVIVTLDEQQVASRFKSMDRKPVTGTTRNRDRSNATVTDEETAAVAVLGRGGTPISQDSMHRVSGPHVRTKNLNEFLPQNIGDIFKLDVKVLLGRKLTPQHYLFEVTQEDNGRHATIELKHDFFQRNIIRINEMLDFLVKYVASHPNELTFRIMAELTAVSPVKMEIVQDFMLQIRSISRDARRSDTLAQFVHYYSEENHPQG